MGHNRASCPNRKESFAIGGSTTARGRGRGRGRGTRRCLIHDEVEDEENEQEQDDLPYGESSCGSDDSN